MQFVVILSSSRRQSDHIHCRECIGESRWWSSQNWYLHTNCSCTKEGKALLL